MDFNDIWDRYAHSYLITLPNNQWVAEIKATSLYDAQQKARKIQKERCLFAYNLWLLTEGTQDENY